MSCSSLYRPIEARAVAGTPRLAHERLGAVVAGTHADAANWSSTWAKSWAWTSRKASESTPPRSSPAGGPKTRQSSPRRSARALRA